MKAIRSNRKITPYGGIVPILELIKKCKVPQAIRSTLGKRVDWATYEYDDVFIAMILTILCGGKRIDHISKLRKKLDLIPNLKLPSHDTLGRVMKKLATENDKNESKENHRVSYAIINDNLPLNEMLVKTTKQLGLLNTHQPYTLDIDATFVYTKSKEAKRGHNGSNKTVKIGHSPMVCLIDNLPVYVSLRSGNSSSSLRLKETLDDSITLLNNENIKIGRVRSDGALGSSTKTMDFLHERGIIFNTRKPFQKHGTTFMKLFNDAEWSPIRIKTFHYIWDCEITDFPYKMYDSEHTYRIIALKAPSRKTRKLQEIPEGQFLLDKGLIDKIQTIKLEGFDEPKGSNNPHDGWVAHEGYVYKLLITNDFKSSPEQLILEYNKRGGTERNFDHLKNCSAWKIPPFMRLNENTVYLIVAALANNVFRASVKEFKAHVPGLYKNCTLATFKFLFIDVACAYIRGEFVFYDTDIAFEKIC